MKSKYLEQVHLGKNSWKRYLLALGLLISSLFLMIIPIVFVGIYLGIYSAIRQSEMPEIDNQWFYQQAWPLKAFVFIWVMAVFLGAIYLIVTKVHRRKISTLICSDEHIDKRRLLYGFPAGMLIGGLTSFAFYLTFPQLYQFNQNWNFLNGLSSMLATIPIAVLTATFYFFLGGYILQALSLFIKSALVLVALSSLLIAIPNLVESETSLYFLSSFLSIFLILLVLLKDDRIELLIGLLAGRAFWSLSFVSRVVPNGNDSAFPALILIQAPSEPLSPVLSVLISCGHAIAFYIVAMFLRSQLKGRSPQPEIGP